jgi:hypothetical protein
MKWFQLGALAQHPSSLILKNYIPSQSWEIGYCIDVPHGISGLRFKGSRITTKLKNGVSLEEVLNILHGVKKVGDNQWQSLCPVPAHDDHDPSFHISRGKDGRILMQCKCGCSFNDICHSLNIEPRDLFSDSSQAVQQGSSKKTPWVFNPDKVRPLSTEELTSFANSREVGPEALRKFQPYADQRKPLILVPAYNPSEPAEPCGLMRLAPDGGLVTLANGRQEKSPILGKHGLLGIPWLVEQKPDEIILAEGWRDALAAIALGFYATASSGGASCFKKEWLPLFKDKIAYLCFDRDTAGDKAETRAVKALNKVARQVKILNLSYSMKLDHGNDLHDFIVRDGNSREEILELMNQTQVSEQSKPSTEEQPAGYNRTDARNGERFTEQHGEKMRYCRRLGGWFFFDGRRWNSDIGTDTANRLAVVTARKIIQEALALK